MNDELPTLVRVEDLAVLQTDQDFEAAWNRLDDDKRSEHRQENDLTWVGFPAPFERSFQTNIDGASSFKNAIETIRKCTSFTRGQVSIYYGHLFRLEVDLGGFERYSSSGMSLFRNFEFKYTLTPSQHSPPNRYQYDPDISTSHFKEILQAFDGLENLSLSLREEAWLLEEDLPDGATAEFRYFYSCWPYALSFSFETPSQKPYSMRLQYISPDVLPSMAPWTKKILSCIGIDGIPEAEGTSLERWFERFLGAVGLSGLKYLCFYNTNVKPEIWRALSGISSLERLQTSNEYPVEHRSYRSNTGLCLDFVRSIIDESEWHLLSSRLKHFEDLQEVDISYTSPLTHTSVDQLIQGVFNNDAIIRFSLPTTYEHHIDETLKHHLNMNKTGRRIIKRSPNLIPALAPILLEYASKKYPLTGVFILLRNDLDLAKVFGSVKKRRRKIPSKLY